MVPKAPKPRPLSPHLQVYKWGPHMLVSILHRATGDGMAIGGSVILLWWLMAAASGPRAYQLFLNVATSWFGTLVLVGITWGFFQHMCSGLRHLYMDSGRGYELAGNRRSALITFVLSALLTGFTWAIILLTNRG
jgi:succinate dehydrogenase / fumarate reductase, cytochrome b subunit